MRTQQNLVYAAPRRSYSPPPSYPARSYTTPPDDAGMYDEITLQDEITNPLVRHAFNLLPKETQDKIVSVARSQNLDLNKMEDYGKVIDLVKNGGSTTTASGTGASVEIKTANLPKDKQMAEATKRGAFALGGAAALGAGAFFLSKGSALLTTAGALAGFAGVAIGFQVADPINFDVLMAADPKPATPAAK